MGNVDIDHFVEAINRELTIYSTEIADTLKNEAKEHMKQLVKKTKETAPVGKRGKHYRDCIKSKKTHENSEGATYTWYVEGRDYRLTHLLDKGHATKNGGRVEGTHFLEHATDEVISAYTQRIEEVLKNG